MTTVEPTRNARPGPNRLLPETENFATAEPASLIQAVQAAVRAADQSRLVPLVWHDAGPVYQPKMLLALLSYSYALQIYSSAEIEKLMRRDTQLRQLCYNQLPDARIICRFRRENREAIRRCLEAALSFLAEQKVANGFVTRIRATHLAEEASRRIITAMFIDSMELNGDQTPEASVDLCYLFANGRARAH